MATITVTTNADTGAGSLRNAISNAANGDTIVFDPSLQGTTIAIGSTLSVSNGITIDGGSNNITIDGQGQSTDFTVSVASGSTTEIDNLSIVNGNGTGQNNSTVPIREDGGNAGGGIYSNGNLVLNNDSFTNNHATGGAGSNANNINGNNKAAGNGGNAAGAVYVNSGTVTASNLVFSGNSAVAGQGGAADPTDNLAGGSPGSAFPNSNDSNVNSAAVCFADGTLIRTARGDVAVDDLAVGDLAVTASGTLRPIKWLGHRTIDCSHQSRLQDVRPIRIAAHAFGESRPSRDLFVSPGHAICVDMLGEVLIPAGALVNGSTIQQVEVDEVTYWHVELDSHDILLAENLACESYLDMGNRGFFKEADVVDLAAGPDAAASRTHADFCRPFHADGSLVAFVRERLAARAGALGWRLSDADPWAGVHVLADGVRIEPDVRGLAARFAIPAATRDVWLVSPAASPHEIGMSADGRRLGLNIAEMRVGADWDTRSVALDDPLLCAGFHATEGAADSLHRWTAGRARLPAALWAGAEPGEDLTLILRLCSGSAALPRWVGPEAGAGERDDVLAA